MSARSWDSEIARKEMARLTVPGVLGFYTHFEVTEVFAVPAGQSTPVNVFTILVAEERLSAIADKPDYLSPERIKLKSLKGWVFGIKRYVKPIADLVSLFDVLCASNKWRPSGESLHVANLTPIPTQFVPPDSIGGVPWNRVLKNNFWNGSHVFEWADPAKTALKPMFDDPPVLQELSEAVRAYVPIGLGSLSDRLGNIAVQLPITILIANFGEMRVSGDFTVTIAWHLKATPRALRATCEMEYDATISGYRSANIRARETLLPIQHGQGMHRGVVWDDENNILLAASGDMSFIKTVAFNLQVLDPEPRVFTVSDGSGGEKEIRVGVTPKSIKNIVGDPATNPAGDWTQRRMYQEETTRLVEERRFVQYKPDVGQQFVQHEKALSDLRYLVNRHGEEGVWLWDPYLSAEDVIDTLFYCRFFGSDLRALSAGDIAPVADQSREAASSSHATRGGATLHSRRYQVKSAGPSFGISRENGPCRLGLSRPVFNLSCYRPRRAGMVARHVDQRSRKATPYSSTGR